MRTNLCIIISIIIINSAKDMYTNTDKVVGKETDMHGKKLTGAWEGSIPLELWSTPSGKEANGDGRSFEQLAK